MSDATLETTISETVRPERAPGADCCHQAEHGAHGYGDNKQAHLRRLRRIEGQVRGLARMIEQGDYCIDILTQVSATTRALQSMALGLLEEHLNGCVAAAIHHGDNPEAKIAEASAAIGRLVRS